MLISAAYIPDVLTCTYFIRNRYIDLRTDLSPVRRGVSGLCQDSSMGLQYSCLNKVTFLMQWASWQAMLCSCMYMPIIVVLTFPLASWSAFHPLFSSSFSRASCLQCLFYTSCSPSSRSATVRSFHFYISFCPSVLGSRHSCPYHTTFFFQLHWIFFPSKFMMFRTYVFITCLSLYILKLGHFTYHPHFLNTKYFPPFLSKSILIFVTSSFYKTEITTYSLPYLPSSFFYPRPDRFWGPPSLLSIGYQGLFPWG
jgi:hypothetical protein